MALKICRAQTALVASRLKSRVIPRNFPKVTLASIVYVSESICVRYYPNITIWAF